MNFVGMGRFKRRKPCYPQIKLKIKLEAVLLAIWLSQNGCVMSNSISFPLTSRQKEL